MFDLHVFSDAPMSCEEVLSLYTLTRSGPIIDDNASFCCSIQQSTVLIVYRAPIRTI